MTVEGIGANTIAASPFSTLFTSSNPRVDDNSTGRLVALNLTVKLENPQRLSNFNHSNQVAVVLLRPGTNQIVFGPRIINTDASGYSGGLNISGIQPGIYDICAKARHYLGQCARNKSVSPGSTIIMDFSNGGARLAWLGDIDTYGEDNQENTLDFERIKAACFIQGLCGRPYPEFDMNRDGTFDTQDAMLVLARVGLDLRGEGYVGKPFPAAVTSSEPNAMEPTGTGTIRLEPAIPNFIAAGAERSQSIVLDTGGASVSGVDVMLYYDPEVVQILDEDSGTAGVQVQSAGVFPIVTRNRVDSANGIIWFSARKSGNSDQFTGTATVANFRIRILAGTPNESFTRIIPMVVAGDSTDSNGAQYGTARDIIGAGIPNSFITVGFRRHLPEISLTPPSNSVHGGGAINAVAQINDASNQVDCVRFTLLPDTGNPVSQEDCDRTDGWSATLDTSHISDQAGVTLAATVRLRATQLEYTAQSVNLTLDRTPPQLDAVTFTPNIPSPGQNVVVEVRVRDNLGPNVHLELWANKATDGSDRGDWVRVDWGDFLRPNGSQIWLQWDTNGFAAGSHLVSVTMRDDAGNWNGWTTTRILGTNALTHAAYLPLIGNKYTGGGSYYRITSVLCDKVLDVEWGSMDDGAPMILYPWHGGASEIWSVEPADGDYVTIRSVLSGRCLDLPGGTDQGGAQLIQWWCHGGENQQWHLIRVGDSFVVQSRQSGKVLDVWNGSCEDHTPVIQWDRHDGDNQRWYLIQAQRPAQ